MIGHWQRLSAIRKLSGLTQAELANRLGISQANVARLEKESDASGDTGQGKGNDGVSLRQVVNWLVACGFPQETNLAYELALQELPPQPVRGFLIAMDEMLRCAGLPARANAKPTLAVISSSEDDHHLSVRVLRNLLNTTERSFHGFLLVQPEATIVLKHISERPTRINDAACVLDGILEKEMLASPPDYLATATTEDGFELSGTAIVLEQCGSRNVGVLYVDHPLLRFVDIVRPGLASADERTIFELDLVADAELLIVCCGATRHPSPTAFLCACLATRADLFIAHATGIDPSQFIEILESSGCNILGRISVDDFRGTERNNAAILKTLVDAVGQLDASSCSERRWALSSESDLWQQKASRPKIRPPTPVSTAVARLIVSRLFEGATRTEGGDIVAASEMLKSLKKYARGELNWHLPSKELSIRSIPAEYTLTTPRRREYSPIPRDLLKAAHRSWSSIVEAREK